MRDRLAVMTGAPGNAREWRAGVVEHALPGNHFLP